MRVDVIVVTSGLLQRLRQSDTLTKAKLESSDESLWFVHMTRPETTIKVLYSEVPVRFARIYPNRGSLELVGIQDSTFHDLDPDYELQHLFGQQQCSIYAIVDKIPQDSGKRRLSEMYSILPSKHARIDVGNTSLDNSGILMISQESFSQDPHPELPLHVPTRETAPLDRSAQRSVSPPNAAVVPTQTSTPARKVRRLKAKQNIGSPERQVPGTTGRKPNNMQSAAPKNNNVSENIPPAVPASNDAPPAPSPVPSPVRGTAVDRAVPVTREPSVARETPSASSNEGSVNPPKPEVNNTEKNSAVASAPETANAVPAETPVKTPKRRGPQKKTTIDPATPVDKVAPVEALQPSGENQPAATATLTPASSNGESTRKPRRSYKKAVAVLEEAANNKPAPVPAVPHAPSAPEAAQTKEPAEQPPQTAPVKPVVRRGRPPKKAEHAPNETAGPAPAMSDVPVLTPPQREPVASQDAPQTSVATKADVPRVVSVPQPVLPLRLSRAAAQDANRKLKEHVSREATIIAELAGGDGNDENTSRRVSFADEVRAQEQALSLAMKRPLRGASSTASPSQAHKSAVASESETDLSDSDASDSGRRNSRRIVAPPSTNDASVAIATPETQKLVPRVGLVPGVMKPLNAVNEMPLQVNSPNAGNTSPTIKVNVPAENKLGLKGFESLISLPAVHDGVNKGRSAKPAPVSNKDDSLDEFSSDPSASSGNDSSDDSDSEGEQQQAPRAKSKRRGLLSSLMSSRKA